MEYRVLGPFEVRHDGEVLELGGPRPRALLAALVLHRNEPVSADRLIELVWGEPGTKPRKTLQVAMSRLRGALGPAATIETRESAYRLRTGLDEVDADRFAALLEAGRAQLEAGDAPAAAQTLKDALALWHGEALAEFRYAEFAERAVEELEELRLVAFELRVEAELRCGRHAMVVPELERHVAEHPRRERQHAQLMLALYRCGRQAEALAVYRRLRTALAGELGLEPGAEVRRLQQRILRQDPELTPGDEPLPAALVHAQANPLAGRAVELDELTAAGAGHALVLVTGDAGVGKTRLLAAAAARLRGVGWRVLYGRADEDGMVPYQPFVEAFRDHLAHDPRLGLAEHERLATAAAPAAMLLPELEPLLNDDRPPAWEEPEAARYRLYVAVASLLARLAGRGRLLLVLDDLQWADRPSLRLVRELIAGPGAREVLVLGAARAEDPAEPLADLVAELHRERRLRRIALRGLEATAIAEFDGVESLADAEALALATRGNPFLIEHLLPQLAGAGLRAQLERMEVPDAVREVVTRRLRALPDDVRDTLAVASVLGTTFRLSDVEAITRRPALDALERAERARLIEPGAETDHFAFAHDLLRRTVYGTLSASRATRLHQQAGEALEAAGADAAELVRHYSAALDVGDPSRLVGPCLELARRHAEAHAHAEAIEHYERALVALRRGAADPALEAELLLGLAASLEYHDIGAARDAYRQAAGAGAGPEVTARAAVGFATWQLYGVVDTEALALLERALRELPDEPSPLRARAQCLYAARLPAAEQPRRESLWRDAAAMARGDDDALTAILRYAPYVLWRPESLADRIAAAEETVERAGSADARLWGCINVFVEQLESGAAGDALDAALELAGDTRSRWFGWHLPMLEGTRALLRGELATGERLARRSLELRTAVDPEADETFAAQLAMLVRLRGAATEEALAALDRQIALYAERPVWRALLADLQVLAGREEDARATIAALVAAGPPAPPNLDRLPAQALVAEAAARLGDHALAQTLAAQLEPFAGRFVVIDRGWAVWGSLSRVLAVVAAARGERELATRHFDAAAREHTAARMRPWLAHTLADRASLLGDAQASEEALTLAAELGLDGVERTLAI